MNDIEVQLVGNVVTAPELRLTKGGRSVTSFRLASAPRVPDGIGGWRDGETSFMTVTCWNATAENVVLSFKKGHRVLLFGTLKIAEWEKDVDSDAKASGMLQAPAPAGRGGAAPPTP